MNAKFFTEMFAHRISDCSIGYNGVLHVPNIVSVKGRKFVIEFKRLDDKERPPIRFKVTVEKEKDK